jgi:hypothetical protein
MLVLGVLYEKVSRSHLLKEAAAERQAGLS